MSPGTVTDRARSSYLCCSEMIGATTGTGALVANQTLTTTGAVSEGSVAVTGAATLGGNVTTTGRSEERRVGKEGNGRVSADASEDKISTGELQGDVNKLNNDV